MISTMQDVPLGIRRMLEHAVTVFPGQKLLTAQPDGSLATSTFSEAGANAARLAHALTVLGVAAGERVATLMWNNQQHVEAYFAIPAMGAVLHTLNLRLAGEQIVFIANHAQDKVLLVDHTLVPALTALLPAMKTVEHVIVNGPADLAALAAAAGRPVETHDYAELIAGRPGIFAWPELPETAAAAMCYTSGTTGDPKGVVYSHRSIFLHSMGAALPRMMGLSSADRVLVIVPQFHALSWGLPYLAFLTGTELVLPGPFLQAEPLAKMIEKTRLNKAAGVPTIWQALLVYLRACPQPADVSSLTEAIVGGSACPPALMEAYDRLGITLIHAYGMTETSPMVTVARPPAGLTAEQAWPYRLTQGRFSANVEARLVGVGGEILPWDGRSAGELELRGPWITGSYYCPEASGAPDPERFHDGWLRTGDVGHISADGYLTLTDRAKDVIKSGGEWISSVDLENRLMGHPAVAEASVIGVPDERWGERPFAVVALRPGAEATLADLREFLACQLPRWQVPERWQVIAEVPKTSVGKFDKKRLREQYAGGELVAELIPAP